MPIYREGRNKYRVVVATKNQRGDWIINGSREDAEKWEAQKRLEFAASAGEIRAVPKFSEWCKEHYAAHALLRLKESTRRNRAYVIADLIAFYGETKLDCIDEASTERYAASRLRHGLKPQSINTELRCLRRILNFARERGVIMAAPKWQDLPERGEKQVKAWTPAEIGRLYDSCMTHRPELLPLVVFLANTGCRKGEAIALKWETIDLERRVITIWPSEEWQPKSGKPREIPINDVLLRWLGQLKDGRTKWRCGKPSAYVFPSRSGRRLRFWPQRDFDALRKAAKLEGGPHRLRHSFATQWINAGGSYARLSEVLGHSEQHVTRLYRHLLPGASDKDRNLVAFAPEVGAAEAEAKRRWKR